MEEKIYNEIKEKNFKTTSQYLKALGIIDENDNVKGGTPKKNIDLGIILSQFGLIELNEETSEIIDEYHDYVFKLGIELGVNSGKKMIIEAIKNDDSVFDELMKIDPNEYTNYSVEPSFIDGVREAILNEK